VPGRWGGRWPPAGRWPEDLRWGGLCPPDGCWLE